MPNKNKKRHREAEELLDAALWGACLAASTCEVLNRKWRRLERERNLPEEQHLKFVRELMAER